MNHFFLDSSALVKRHAPERGTFWKRSLSAPRNDFAIVIAEVMQVEMVSAIMRRRRDGSLSDRSAHTIRRLADRHAARDYLVIELTGAIIQRAEDLLEHHALRAFDAVQLATALETNERLMADRLTGFEFVSADTRLLAVAAQEGLSTSDPNQRP